MCFENPWSGLGHLPSVGDRIQHDLSHFRGKRELARLWETHNPDVVVSRFKVVQETPWSSLPLLLRGLPTNIEANLFVI